MLRVKTFQVLMHYIFYESTLFQISQYHAMHCRFSEKLFCILYFNFFIFAKHRLEFYLCTTNYLQIQVLVLEIVNLHAQFLS